jgi:hypothetical protein
MKPSQNSSPVRLGLRYHLTVQIQYCHATELFFVLELGARILGTLFIRSAICVLPTCRCWCVSFFRRSQVSQQRMEGSAERRYNTLVSQLAPRLHSVASALSGLSFGSGAEEKDHCSSGRCERTAAAAAPTETLPLWATVLPIDGIGMLSFGERMNFRYLTPPMQARARTCGIRLPLRQNSRNKWFRK